MATPDSEQQIAGMKAPTTAFRPDSAGADTNPRFARHARFLTSNVPVSLCRLMLPACATSGHRQRLPPVRRPPAHEKPRRTC
jgi:hypothetical protein